MELSERNILVLYDDRALNTAFVREHLSAFARYSRFNIHYFPSTRSIPTRIPLSAFDAVIIHFSVRLPYLWHLDRDLAVKLSKFPGCKIAMPQDEYDSPHIVARRFEQLGIGHVFTNVPEAFLDDFYPPDVRGTVTFHQCLTGYVGDPDTFVRYAQPQSRREITIGYRGRVLPVWYGKLGDEKAAIGERMRAACIEHGVTHDIEIREGSRIQNADWYRFLGSVRATLGSETGCNVIDPVGAIQRECKQLAAAGQTRSEIYERVVKACDGRVTMNQIAPKIFEAAQLKTGLILFEGQWSNILKPDTHYIALKKDFSNIGEVFAKVHDENFVTKIVNQTYADVVESGRFSYRSFVARIDDILTRELPPVAASRFVSIRVPLYDGVEYSLNSPLGYGFSQPVAVPQFDAVDSVPLSTGRLRSLWIGLPRFIKIPLEAIMRGPLSTIVRHARMRKMSRLHGEL